MGAKPIKALGLHYPTIQFLIFWIILSFTVSSLPEEDATEGMEEGQDELQQAETAETSVEREIPTTEQLNVQETEGQLLEQRGATPTTAPYAQRLLSARSHLAPFSFPQVRA